MENTKKVSAAMLRYQRAIQINNQSTNVASTTVSRVVPSYTQTVRVNNQTPAVDMQSKHVSTTSSNSEHTPLNNQSANVASTMVSRVVPSYTQTVRVNNQTPAVDMQSKQLSTTPSKFDQFINACYTGDLYIVSRLLQTVQPESDNNKAIIAASKNGHVDIVKLLITDSRVDPGAQNNEVLIEACRNNKLSLVKLLLDHPSVDAGARDNYALATSCDRNDTKMIELLLTKPSVKVKAIKNQGLIKFCSRHDIPIIELILPELKMTADAYKNNRGRLDEVVIYISENNDLLKEYDASSEYLSNMLISFIHQKKMDSVECLEMAGVINKLYSECMVNGTDQNKILKAILIKHIKNSDNYLESMLKAYPFKTTTDQEFIAIFEELAFSCSSIAHQNIVVLDFIAKFKVHISDILLKIRLDSIYKYKRSVMEVDFTSYNAPTIEMLQGIITHTGITATRKAFSKLIHAKNITLDVLISLMKSNYHIDTFPLSLLDEFISNNNDEITIEQRFEIAKTKVYCDLHNTPLRKSMLDLHPYNDLKLSLIKLAYCLDGVHIIENYMDILCELPDLAVLDMHLDWCTTGNLPIFEMNKLAIARKNPNIKILSQIANGLEFLEVSGERFPIVIKRKAASLSKTLSNMWCTSNKHGYLLSGCVEKIANFEIKKIDDAIKLKNMFVWVFHSAVRLEAHVGSNYIQNMLDAETVKINSVFNEILKYNEPDKRIGLTINLISIIKSDSSAVLFSLIHKQPLHLCLPGLLLTTILTETSSYKTVESKAKAVLKNIPRDYRDGNKLRTMISGLQSICNTNKISPMEKIVIVEKILYKTEYELCIETADVEEKAKEVIKKWELNNKDNCTKFLLVNVKNTDEIFLSGLTQQGVRVSGNLKEIPELSKLSNLVTKFKANLKKSIFRVPTNLRKEWIKEITSSSMFMDKTDISAQKERFMLCQGLGDCNAIDYLNASNVATYGSNLFHKAYANAIREKFCLNNYSDKQMEYFWENIGKCHNQKALITYYGRLSTLPAREKSIFLSLLNLFVQQITSKNAQSFYTKRYDEASNLHIKKVFATDPQLRDKWIRPGVRYNLKHLMHAFNVSGATTKINFRDFLFNKICLHKHLPEAGFEDIHNYLKGKTITEGIELDEQDATGAYKLALKIKLVELCTADDLPVNEKTAALSSISATLRKIDNKSEFLNDIESFRKLLHSQKSSSKLADVAGWGIVDSDYFWHLFMAGTDVSGSCQRVNGSAALNKALIGGYVLSGHIRMLAIVDKSNQIQARCILRLHLDEEANKAVLFMEDVYPEALNNQLKEALFMLAKIRALQLNCILVDMDGRAYSSPYPRSIKVTHVNVCEYVDALHSKQTGPYQIGKSKILFNPTWYRKSISDYIADKEILKSILPKQALVDLKQQDQGMDVLANPWLYAYVKHLVVTGKTVLHHNMPKQPILHLKQACQAGLVNSVYWKEVEDRQQQRQIVAVKLNDDKKDILKFSC